MTRMKLLASLLFAAGLALPAQPAAAADITLLNVSYDPTRELYRDINAAFAAEETRLAYSDPLTGLGNRALLAAEVTRAQHRLRGGGRLSLLVLDLDGFKAVNDSLGHAVGDRLLVQLAERLCAAVGPQDMVARLGGDEFAVLVAEEGPGAGLRTARRLSHVFRMEVETYAKPILITDAAINIHPDLEAKVDIVQNAIDLAHVLGIAEPRVAILSAVETVNPKIQSTLDAAALCKMADRRQITGGVLDGPLAFDNAISADAARTKGIKSPVSGLADILVVPDLESGNMLAKQLEYLASAVPAGIVLGAKAPIVLTSRADNAETRMASCVIAVLMANANRQKQKPA